MAANKELCSVCKNPFYGVEQYIVVYVICIFIVDVYKSARVVSFFFFFFGNLPTNVWHVPSSLDLLGTIIHQSNLSAPCQHRMLQSYIPGQAIKFARTYEQLGPPCSD
jgi:hypothetical protein